MEDESYSTSREPERTKTTHQRPNPPEDSQPLSNLPQEIIFDILSRLPVKFLMQFRCVCKSWRSLISSPQFVKTHLSVSSESVDYSSQRLILSSINPSFDVKSCSLYSVFHEYSNYAVDLDYPLKHCPHESVWIVGSCNGLVSIAFEEDAVFLWNPSTRKSKRVPDSGFRIGYGYSILYGFGYDESRDDYKVVRIFCKGGSCETEGKVYSLRTDSWRRIGDFPYGIPLMYSLETDSWRRIGDFPLDDSGIYVNGALHWAANANSGLGYSWVIVSLDLAKETYEEVVQPCYGDGGHDLTLGVLKGCLCVLCNFLGTRADVWVMKDYGLRESWTKEFTIPYVVGPGNNYEYFRLLCISKNGEILLNYGSSLLLYDTKDGTFRNPEIRNRRFFDGAYTFVESLVSPDADNGF